MNYSRPLKLLILILLFLILLFLIPTGIAYAQGTQSPTVGNKIGNKIRNKIGSKTDVRVIVQVEHRWGNEALRFQDVSLRNGAGNTLSVTRLAYLVSGFALIRADGTLCPLDATPAYLNPGRPATKTERPRTSFDLDAVPAGRYRGLTFQIGLPKNTNHASPAHYSADHPLNPLVNQLHWNWQGGYVFLALEGRYTQSVSRLGGFVYHIANDANRMTVTLRGDIDLTQDSQISLRFDVRKLFDGPHPIAIRSDHSGESTHSAPGDTLATAFKTNAEQAFALASVAPVPTVPNNAKNNSGQGEGAITYPPHTTPYPFPVPAEFPQPQLPADNPLTVEGIALGKRLFFEKRLSGNNTQSCASCHRPEAAFSDAGKATSRGIDGVPGTRRAMPLFNLAWSGSYTWDGRRTRLRDQALAPIQDAREMHQTLTRTLAKLSADHDYPTLFAHAFGTPGVTAPRLGLAIEQYLLTLISADSKFDRAFNGTDGANSAFTDQEKRGLQLFITEYDPARGIKGADCFHCHGGSLFTDYQFKNNGLKPDPTRPDTGRFQTTGESYDRYRFKTPSLRNVELTGPYMHDGRFATLADVIAHYNSGVHRSQTLDPNIAKHPDGGLHLSSEDQKALVAFLKTLTETRLKQKGKR